MGREGGLSVHHWAVVEEGLELVVGHQAELVVSSAGVEELVVLVGGHQAELVVSSEGAEGVVVGLDGGGHQGGVDLVVVRTVVVEDHQTCSVVDWVELDSHHGEAVVDAGISKNYDLKTFSLKFLVQNISFWYCLLSE